MENASSGQNACQPPSGPSAVRIRRRLGGLLVGTFALKCWIVFACGPSFDFHSDDRGYVQSARILLETGMLTYNDPTRPTAFITPALPGVLALLMYVFGTGLMAEQAFRVLQAALMSGSLGLLYLIGRRLFRERIALRAVALCAFYPPLWLVSNMVLTEGLFTFAVLLLVYVALWAAEHPSAKSGLVFGLVWAAAVYVRPTIALWPGLLFLLLACRRELPWQRSVRFALAAAAVFAACLLPWWVRNYGVSGGQFIPLTRASGNPLLLGSYPYTVPAQFMDEQRTWHTSDDLWVNEEVDKRRAEERIKEGFRKQFLLYLSWYTVGKFALFWGDVYYWLPVPGVPLAVAVLYHYALLIPGFIGLFASRRMRHVPLVISLLAYFSLLHMVYLAHSRYAVPLMPLMALFAAYALAKEQRKRGNGNGEEIS